MRSEVPKFIEVEDKIFGPFTWKQFLYLLGGAGAILIAQHFIKNLFWAIIVTSPITATALALTFYKVNGQSFSIILQAAIQYYFKQKLYKFGRVKKEKKEIMMVEKIEEAPDKSARIEDVSWGLDVLDR